MVFQRVQIVEARRIVQRDAIACMDGALLSRSNGGGDCDYLTIALFANGQVGLIVQQTACIACYYPWHARRGRVAVEENRDQSIYSRAYEEGSHQQQRNAKQQRPARPDAWSPAPPGEYSVPLLPISSLVVQPLVPF